MEEFETNGNDPLKFVDHTNLQASLDTLFLIIENLYKNVYSLKEIALKLGLYHIDDEINILANAKAVINEYLEELRQNFNVKGNNIYTQEDLRNFLKSNYLNI